MRLDIVLECSCGSGLQAHTQMSPNALILDHTHAVRDPDPTA